MRGSPANGVYWPANLNAYGYVANNPIKYVDEHGEFIALGALALFALGGAVVGGGLELYQQYSSMQAPVGLDDFDFGRVGFAAGVGAGAGAFSGVASAAFGAGVGWQLLAGAASGLGVGMGSSVSWQLYNGATWSSLDLQMITQSGVYGAAGGFVGAAAGSLLNLSLSGTSSLIASRNAGPMTHVLVDNISQNNKTTLGNVIGKTAPGVGITAGDLAGPVVGEAYSQGAQAAGRPSPDQGGALVPTPKNSQEGAANPSTPERGINPSFAPYLRDARESME